MNLKACYKPCSPIRPEKRSIRSSAGVALKRTAAAFAKIRVVCILEGCGALPAFSSSPLARPAIKAPNPFKNANSPDFSFSFTSVALQRIRSRWSDGSFFWPNWSTQLVANPEIQKWGWQMRERYFAPRICSDVRSWLGSCSDARSLLAVCSQFVRMFADCPQFVRSLLGCSQFVRSLLGCSQLVCSLLADVRACSDVRAGCFQ